MQRSILPTYHFQKSLPRLPIPKLDHTCERYLLALKPLLDDYAMGKTTTVVREFEKGEGVALQKQLVDEDKLNKRTSYISKPWFDMYLSDRTPLPINYNPCLVYIPVQDDFYDQQLIKTTNLIISSMRWVFFKFWTSILSSGGLAFQKLVGNCSTGALYTPFPSKKTKLKIFKKIKLLFFEIMKSFL